MSAPPPYNPSWDQSYDSKYPPPPNNSGMPPQPSAPGGWQMPPQTNYGYGGSYGVVDDTPPQMSGGYDPYKDDVEAQQPNRPPPPVSFAAPGFSDVNIRAAFVRKVYFTLSTQLGITFAIVALFVNVDSVKTFVRENSALYYVGYVIFLISYFMLVCCQGLRRKFPANVGLLMIFTLAFSYMIGVISSYYDLDSIFMALGITTGVTLAVSIFSFQTKYDFTKWLGVAVVVSFCLFFFGFFMIFFYSKVMHLIYAGIGAILFTVFLAIDTQMIVGGKRHEIDPEDHILGAILLYIDIVYIFLFILQILGRSGN
ncbi:protein lifeguard 3-like [Symsagittifera roscoffensis]|uniref:protein lifeguard 3-like n=1 Tax=Symsagittifera roscoffensis TaxID=84072 RepID=UPI00307C3A49